MRRIFYIGLCFAVSLLVIGIGISVAANAIRGNPTITQTAVITDNGGYQIIDQTVQTAVPPTEFNGPTYTSDLGGGSGLEVVLSSPSVEVGGTLWMRVRLTGPAAWSNSGLRFTVTNSSGENVYDIALGHPHRTLAPGESPDQEDVFNLRWEAKSSETAGNVEVTPGTYSFFLGDYSLAWGVRGTIEVK